VFIMLLMDQLAFLFIHKSEGKLMLIFGKIRHFRQPLKVVVRRDEYCISG
jgi:hypothetical protein